MEIDPRIQKTTLANKGWGYIAIDDIPYGTTILKEAPTFIIPEDEEIFLETLQLLYLILNDKKSTEVFNNLTPRNTKKYMHYDVTLEKELRQLKKIYPDMYHFLTENFSDDELLLYYSKYLCNCFDFYERGPAVLMTGTFFNHSCLPNIVFGRKDGMMHFVTARDIKKVMNYSSVTSTLPKTNLYDKKISNNMDSNVLV